MELAATAIEVLGVGVIVVGIALATVEFVSQSLPGHGRSKDREGPLNENLKKKVGWSVLLGLEILVAADIIRSVALSPTLIAIASLGLLVLVRTFLSWTIVLEIEGRWPWQSRAAAPQGDQEQASLSNGPRSPDGPGESQG
jgi:Predicted membrane protein